MLAMQTLHSPSHLLGLRQRKKKSLKVLQTRQIWESKSGQFEHQPHADHQANFKIRKELLSQEEFYH